MGSSNSVECGPFVLSIAQELTDIEIKCGQSLKCFFGITCVVVNLCPVSPAFLGNGLKSFRTNLV